MLSQRPADCREAVAATREQLHQLPADGDLPASWQLNVVGKGRKARMTPVSDACVAALVAHRRDLGDDFGGRTSKRALIAPLRLPPTPAARAKAARLAADDPHKIGGYAVRAARGLVARRCRCSAPSISSSRVPRRTRCAIRSAPKRWRPTRRSTWCSACSVTRRCKPPPST
jgi:integrase